MKKQIIKLGFTLVEMIISITISMLVMGAIWVIVSWWIKWVLTQEATLTNSDNFYSFYNELQWVFSNTNIDFKNVKTSSWLIIKQYSNFDKGWFSFIWDATFSWIYCKTDLDVSDVDPESKHLYIKTFIPYEEIWEDLFKTWDYEKIFSGTVTSWANTYVSDTLNHVITKNWTIIVWKWYFWSSFSWGLSWTGVYLNNPTWLVLSGSILFISDTLNNRILAYDTVNDKIELLLDIDDGIYEPTWLLYDKWVLYISNSWKNEVLKYSSSWYENNKLDISFKIDKDIYNLKKLEVSFYDWVSNIKPIINNSTNKWYFTIKKWTNNLKSTDYLTWSSNKIVYWFSNFNSSSFTSDIICTADYNKYYEDSWNIINEYINDCNTSTWTLFKKQESNYTNLSNWDTINLKITDIGWKFNTWSIYTKVELIWDALYEQYFPFKIIWDNDLLTKDDNILEVFIEDINYPTWIWKNWSNIIVNSFLDRKKYKYKLDWSNIWSSIDLNDFDFSKLKYNKKGDYLLNVPIDNIDINYNNDLLTLSWSYYKLYNCYNKDENIKREFILKKNFK